MTRILSFAVAGLLSFGATAHAQQSAYDPSKAFKEADKNKSGAIEMSEFYERVTDVYFLGDKNKDGKLAKDEYDAVVVTRTDFVAVDKNGDGFVSESEWVTSRVPLFDASDTDKDGKLSESEINAAYQANKK